MATPSNPRIFLSAGEASGDAYGASLIAELHRRIPAATFHGLGGIAMQREGLDRIARAEDVAVMGIAEIVRHIPRIYSSYRRLVASIKRNRPDVAVLIDFPDVNFRLAKHLHHAGVPVIWFVSPQLWAWKRGRLRWVQQRVTKMLVIFPFEERFYRERGVDAEFVGHPLLETVREARQNASPETATREGFAQTHHLDPAKTWIALLPGSRWKELRANLPTLHELAMSDLIQAAADNTFADGTRIELPANPAAHTRFEFLLPLASTIGRAEVEAFLTELNRDHLKYWGPEAASLRITLLTGPDAARQALEHAQASVVASGTATVLAAVVGNPFVVVYRVSPLTFAIAKKLVEYPEEMGLRRDLNGLLPISMVNLIAGRRAVPELLQDNFNAANVASALAPLLVDSPERHAQLTALAEVRARLAAPTAQSAISRLADAVETALTDSHVPCPLTR